MYRQATAAYDEWAWAAEDGDGPTEPEPAESGPAPPEPFLSLTPDETHILDAIAASLEWDTEPLRLATAPVSTPPARTPALGGDDERNKLIHELWEKGAHPDIIRAEVEEQGWFCPSDRRGIAAAAKAYAFGLGLTHTKRHPGRPKGATKKGKREK